MKGAGRRFEKPRAGAKAEFRERCLKTVIPAERSKVSAGFLFVSLCSCFKPRTRFVLRSKSNMRGL